MSDDTLELLRSFRSATPDATDDVAARVFSRIADTSRGAPARRRRTLMVRVGVPAGVALAVAAVVLVAPWHRGPASVPAAEAARVLQGTLAVLTPRPGWVFHERVQSNEVVPGTTKKRIGIHELWAIDGPPHRYRQIEVNEGFTGTVETGGTAGTSPGYVYDNDTKTIYRSSLSGRFVVGAQLPSASWRSSITRDIRTKRAKVIGKTVIDGRPVYEIEWLVSQAPFKLYVDQTSYAPVEIDYPALGFIDGYWWTKSDRFTAYEYIPPTTANRALTNIRAAHPAAHLAPATAMPNALETRLHPTFYVSSGR